VDLGLDTNLNQAWSSFITKPHRTHIHLTSNEDELAWHTKLSGGQCFAKLGYQTMIETGNENILWWYKKLWKIKGPLKGIIFF